MICVIILTCHQVTSTQIQPFYLGKPARKLCFNMLQCMLQLIRTGFTMAMAMKSLNTGRQCIGQQIGSNSEAGTGSTRVIKFHFYFRVFGIDADTTGNLFLICFNLRIKMPELIKRIKCNMAAALHDNRKIGFGICRRISMCFAPKLLISQTRFINRTGSCISDILSENGK